MKLQITIVQGPFLPIPPLKGGAVEKFFYALAPLWAAQGHSVTYISRQYKGLPDSEITDGIRHIRLPSHPFTNNPILNKYYDFTYTQRVLNVLPPSDIIISNTFFLPMLAKDKFGPVWVHAARFPRGQLSLYGNAKRIQFPSRAILEAALAQAPGLKDKFCVLPYALPHLPEPTAPKTLPSSPTLLYVGRLHPEKGVHLLLKALSHLPAEKQSSLTVKIVGPHRSDMGGGGEGYLDSLKELAQACRSKIDFVGPVFNPKTLANHYAMADLFIYPSLAAKGETFGVAPLEALSHGVPAIVSSLPCFEDFLRDGQNGFVFDYKAHRPEMALANKIEEALSKEPSWPTLSVAARQTAENHTLERVSDLFLEEFRKIIPQAAPPPKPQKLKISIIQGPFLPIPPLKGGAIEKRFYRLSQLWASQGHTVTHICRQFEGLPDNEIKDDIHYIRVKGYDYRANPLIDKYHDFLYSERALKALPEADILISNTFFAPVLYNPRANSGKLWIYMGRHPQHQIALYAKASRIHFPSKAILEVAKKQTPWLKDKFILLPNALPYLPATPKTKTLSTSPKLLYVGRLHPEKGVHLLLKALTYLPLEKQKSLTVKIVGPHLPDMGGGGERYLTKLRNLAAQSAAQVEFVGPIFNPQTLAEHYSQAELFVYPSLAAKGETFGVAPLEALSHGVPTIVSSLPCFADFLRDGENGFVFDYQSKRPSLALAQAIERALLCSSSWPSLSAAARSTSERFTLDTISAILLSEFQKLSQENP